MLSLPDEPNTGSGRYTHSKVFQRVIGLLVILLVAAALFAFLEFIPD